MSGNSGFANYLAARSDTGNLGPDCVEMHDTGAPGGEYRVGPAWYRPGVDAVALFRKYQKRPPNGKELALLAEQIRMIKGGMAKSEELTFEHHHLVLDFIAKTGRLPSGYPSNDRGENQALVRRAIGSVDDHARGYAAAHHTFLDSVGEGIATIGKTVTAPLSAVVHTAARVASGQNVLNSLKSGLNEAIGPAKDITHALSPVLNVAAGVASFVPGLGTVAASGLAAAAALGRGASVGDLALEAARGALPGGAIAKVAFDAAVGIATGASPTGIALAQIRNQIPGGAVATAAFDAGLAVAYHATGKEAAHAASRLPEKSRHVFARPVLAAAAVRAAPPHVHAKIMRKKRANTRPRALTHRAKLYVAHAIRIHAAAKLDTRGISPDAKTYIVERGDSAWRIAQNLTGDGNRHYQELLHANSPPKTLTRNGMTLAPGTTNLAGANFKYLKTGETLKVPLAWIGKFVRASAPAQVAPVGGDKLSLPDPVTVPVTQEKPAAPSTTDPAAAIPAVTLGVTPPVTDPTKLPAGDERDDPGAISQAKAILIAWEHTDGSAAAGLSDYGANAADQSPIWGARDAFELRAFTVWSNAHGTALSLLGDLTQAKLDALVAWAENKSKQVATGQGSVSPAGGPEPRPAGGDGTKAEGPSPIPTETPSTTQASIIPISLPDTEITEGKKKDSGTAFGLGLAAIVLLGLGVAFSGSDRKKAA